MHMKKLLVTMFCLGLAAPLFADGTNQLADEKARVSYAIGMNLGRSFKQQGVEVDMATMEKAIQDVQNGKDLLMTETQARETMMTYQRELRAKTQAKNKAAGEAFLATNKSAPGVQVMSVTLPNGTNCELQYVVITNGTGPKPKATDQVSVNYRGTLLDGTEFDSSFKRGKPANFGVEKVIKGWSEALKQMPVGSKWKLFIPAELAYGESGRPGIPPNSLLTFEVELVAIVPAAPAPAPAAPLTSDIIKVPSADELKKGAKIEVIKPEDVQKAQQQQPPQQPPQPPQAPQ
jgi:FKBP-type peptidyl-prolyl cis-trans isomerase